MKKRVLLLLFIVCLAVGAPFFFGRFYEPAILMYHRVGYPGESPGLYVTAETFERQMEFLKVHHYKVFPLAELIKKIKAGEKVPMNSVAITFDDGTLDNFKNAYPALRKMDFPATIFMITGNIGKEDWLSEEDLRILDASGVSIGSHTVNHTFLPGVSAATAQNEIVESKNRLESILGHAVSLFCYPAGGVTAEIAECVRKAGYEGAVTTNYGKQTRDPYRLHRVKVSEARGSLFNFWIKTTGFYSIGKKRVEAAADYE